MDWKNWPWTEKRSGYTDLIVKGLLTEATGTASALSSGAVEVVAGAYQRAFQAVRITPSSMAAVLTATLLGDMGRRLVRSGEAVYLIGVETGATRPTLYPASQWDIQGDSYRPSKWKYVLTLETPTGGAKQLTASAEQAFHVRFSTDPLRPWSGSSPLATAPDAAKLAANSERQLSQEAGGPVGGLLPVPQSGEEAQLSGLQADIKALAGRTALVETTSGGFDTGRANAPLADWKQQRIGASPPAPLVALRRDALETVCSMYGLPPSLVIDADGTGQREAWRRFAMGTIEPLLHVVAEECAAKLEAVEFDLFDLWAHDLAGRAAAYQRLRQTEMPEGQAQILAGLDRPTLRPVE